MVGSNIEFFREFDRQHGDAVVMGNWLLYCDGALRELTAVGATIEPPRDNIERRKLIVKYREVKLELAVEEFRVLKRELIRKGKQAVKGVENAPTEDDVKKLKELQSKVRKCQVLLADEKKELNRLIKPYNPELEKEEAAVMARKRDILSEIQKLEV